MSTTLKRTPASSLEIAIKMYYLNSELTTDNIKKLFDVSDSIPKKYKDVIREMIIVQEIGFNEINSVKLNWHTKCGGWI